MCHGVRMKSSLGILTATLTTGLLLGSAPTAHADIWRHTDPAGDVRVVEIDEGVPFPPGCSTPPSAGVTSPG